MTPKEALELLDQATAQMSTNRESHARIIEAIRVLRVTLPKEEGKGD